jgi:hypothetical protein
LLRLVAVIPVILITFFAGCEGAPERPNYLVRPTFIHGYTGSVVGKMVLPQKALKRIHRQTGVLPRLGRTFFVLHTTTEGKEQFARVTYLRFPTPSAARTAETALINGSHGNAGASYQGLRRRGTAVVAIKADPASVARVVSEHIRFEIIPTEKTAWLQQAAAKEQATLKYLESQACEVSSNIAQPHLP